MIDAPKDSGESWFIASGSSVMLVAPDANAPSGLGIEFHPSGTVGQPTTRADLFLDAIAARAHADPQWVSDMIAWRIDSR